MALSVGLPFLRKLGRDGIDRLAVENRAGSAKRQGAPCTTSETISGSELG